MIQKGIRFGGDYTVSSVLGDQKPGAEILQAFWRFLSGRVVCCVLFKGGKNEKRVSGKKCL